MRESRSQDIDGLTFTVTQLPAMRSVLLLHKLAKAAGPGILKALGGGGLLQQDVGGLSDAVASAFDRFSGADLESLVRELFETTTVTLPEGRTAPLMPVFNEVLAGKPGTVLKALRFALSVNYSDFWGAALGVLGNLAAAGGGSKAT